MSWAIGHLVELAYLLAWAVAGGVLLRQSRRRSCKVLTVIDGDTFEMLDRSGSKHRVRLLNCDCPEIGQPLGVEIREQVAQWMKGEWVWVSFRGRDKYRRRLAHVWLPDGRHLANTLLSAGLAFPVPGAGGLRSWPARITRKGLWGQSRIQAPWAAATRKKGLFGWWARRRAHNLRKSAR